MSMLEGKPDDVRKFVLAWIQKAKAATRRNLHDVRRDYRSADQVGRVLIFDLLHNRGRLIAHVNYEK